MPAQPENPLIGVILREPDVISEIPLSVLLEKAGEELFPEFDINGPSERFRELSSYWAGQLIAHWSRKLSFFERARQEGRTQPTVRDQREHQLTVGDETYRVFTQLVQSTDLGPSRDRWGYTATFDIKWVSPCERGRFGAGATIINDEFSIYDMTMEVKVRNEPTSDDADTQWNVKIDSGQITLFKRGLVKFDAQGERWVDNREIAIDYLENDWADHDDNIDEEILRAREWARSDFR